MFKHLLVPLDGSRLAEAALRPAAYLARSLGASVTLLHIIERNAPFAIHGEHHLTTADEACAYLGELATSVFPPRISVTSHVHSAELVDVARGIADHVAEQDSDLIVMCTHGRGGLRDWVFGNIAQQVIALRVCPVLVVQPDDDHGAHEFSCDQLLVPLDGHPEHEQGLEVAAALAAACKARLHLLMVVPTLGSLAGQRAAIARFLPGASAALLDIKHEEAHEYLQRAKERWQAADRSVTTEVRRGKPADIISRAARRLKADLIVLGTHGKIGQEAFWSGSVPPQVAACSHSPLLLVPVRESPSGMVEARPASQAGTGR